MTTQLQTEKGIVRVPSGTWTIDPSYSGIGFEVRHMMIATVRGQFREFDANILGGRCALLRDGERLTGAHALGPGAGGWLHEVAPAIRDRAPLGTIHPGAAGPGIYPAALEALRSEVAASRRVAEVAS